ncbi:dihydrodipicolinate synthase family protein [Mycobacterium sp. KBS0706]|uniref:dihydrodipicolinate synthase family protein n=1 Tax=Mycobacterium sp. KBS0706 TaxID=2578109 RepID=UPI00110FE9ED|nr:dihydrodipicolinate synthase family protein [Mycobacterium sp. KBS0706]TSD87376.1 dihydrodipicolinate synthase family protein [Mycobacterium sp. KBS0706]
MAGQRWAGVYTAITTKMDARQEVDLAAVRADVAFQIENGVDGIICCGSIGEASTLTADEKMAIAGAVKEAAGGRPVLLTVAEDSTRAAAALAERAAAAGMDGLMLLPAMRYVSDRRETIQHFRTVARSSGLPIMVYNNPLAYSVDVTPEMFAEMADEPNFVAIKESSGDVRRITDILNTVGNRYAIFTGVDDLALESLMLGAVGWVAGLVCAFPRETVAIHKLVAAGRIPEALEIYRWFMPLLHLDVSLRFVQNVKLAEAIVRGTSTMVRQPRLELQGAERDRVETIVRTALAKRPDLAKYGL